MPDMPEGKSEAEKWEAMMRSIRKAARIAKVDLTERDMPVYLDWAAGSRLHDSLWTRVYAERGVKGIRKLQAGNPGIKHRGSDPKAIAIGESLGLSFDGMQADNYQFTVQRGPRDSEGITFYVSDLSEVEGRLQAKFEEFGVDYPKGGQAAYLLEHPKLLEKIKEGSGQMRGPCCRIKDTLIKQLKDEEEGVIFYSNIAGELDLIAQDSFAEIASHIADTEFKHYLELRGIIDVLTEDCGCERKHLGPPFGK